MNGSNEAQQPSFEDQFRRMVVSNGNGNLNAGHDAPLNKPTVRLPPHKQNIVPSAYSNQPPALHTAPPLDSQPQFQPPHRQQPGPPGLTNPSQSHPSFNQGQSQRQRRAQQTQGSQQPPSFNGPSPGVRFNQGPRGQFAQHQQQQQHPRIDPNTFQRGGQVQGYYQQPQRAPPQQVLFDPRAQHAPINHHSQMNEQRHRQAHYLDQLVTEVIPKIEMTASERSEKEAFRIQLESVIHSVCAADPARLPKVSLECFGSFSSGFASAGSDMDLVIVLQDGSPYTACFSLLEDDLPRALEKELLARGYGAHLLTRTRVPIIKICERPDEVLLGKLREEREGWDGLGEREKYPHLFPESETAVNEQATDGQASAAVRDEDGTNQAPSAPPKKIANGASSSPLTANRAADSSTATSPPPNSTNGSSGPAPDPTSNPPSATPTGPRPPRRDTRPWTRERKAGPLDFPKSGIGIQCDINFFNPLGLHNTALLRCYSLCDPRVRPMVLFVKAWAKRRKINSSYSGTLSSYGYVLMVLHYLANVVRPWVVPNLQGPWRPPGADAAAMGSEKTQVGEWEVHFWRDEQSITSAAQNGRMSNNTDSLGALLAGFFHYYSSLGGGGPQFHWMGDVLSLRSPGGILSKTEKGWVKAKTEEGEGRKVQHRYLFCVEDPFELAHNVARTVTHQGIVAIRDEFRRAGRILREVGVSGQAMGKEGGVFDELIEEVEEHDGEASNAHASQHTDALKTQPTAANPSPRASGQARPPAKQPTRPQAQKLNTADADAFPSLSSAAKTKPAKTPRYKESAIPSADVSEISGERAKAVLVEWKRKNDEKHAESTAVGAAEAVLEGMD